MTDAQNTQLDLFQAALGLADPWTIQDVTFSQEEGRLDITLRHRTGASFPCSRCAERCDIHDTMQRTWRHLNFFQYEAYLHAPVPRIQCGSCGGTKQVDVPWARSGSGFTLLFEAFVMELAKAMPLTTVGHIIEEHDTRIMRIVTHYVHQGRVRVDMKNVRSIGTDETSKAKGHSYVTTVIDLEEPRVLFVTKGRDSSTIERFVADLRAHGGDPDQITQACSDLAPAYKKGIAEHLPNAEHVFDPFHVTKLVSEALDTVRRREQRDNPLLKGSRYAWLHNPETATEKQTALLATLTTQNLHTARAYRIRLALREVYALRDSDTAVAALKRWYFWATHSQVPEMVAVAKSIKRHWNGIVAFFNKRISNGRVEGMNSIIQTIKRRARGYGNTNNFITMIYLVCGKLTFDLPKVCGVTHSK